MKDAKPLVSICSITYNHASNIKKCLDGFLMQRTNFAFEVLIHDDASTDGTEKIIRAYQAKHPEIIKPLYETENQWTKGRKGSVVFNFPRTRGKYIALCEGDDYWTDELKLQKQVDFLEQNPDYSGCFHNSIIRSNENEVLFINAGLKKTISLEDLMEMKSCGHTSSWVFRKRAIQNPRSYYLKFPVDKTLSILIAENGLWGGLNDAMSVYRINSGGIYGLKSELHQNEFLIKITNALYSDKNFRIKHDKALKNRFVYLYRSRAKIYKKRKNFFGYLLNMLKFSLSFGINLTLLKIIIKEELLKTNNSQK